MERSGNRCWYSVWPALVFALAMALIGAIAPLSAARPSPAQVGATVIDINTIGRGSALRALTAFDGKLFFLRVDEWFTLWRSDGTAEGTVPVKALVPSGSGYLAVASLTVAGPRLMIVLDFAEQTGGIWSSDGTTAGTQLVMPTAGLDFWYRSVAAAGDRFFFTHPGSEGDRLWVSDGTAQGTGPVKDLRLSFPSYPQPRLTAVGDELYFVAAEGSHDPTIWRSDGTEGGTRPVDSADSGAVPASPFGLGAVGDRFYFTTWSEGASSLPLWRTAGTAATTELVLDIPGSWHSATGMAWGDRFVLMFRDVNNSSAQIWVSDGTAAGTTLLMGVSGASSLTVAGEHLFFQGGRSLVVSDGTPQGTVALLDANTMGLTAIGDRLFFQVISESYNPGFWDAAVWVSDGTAEGTRAIYHYQAVKYNWWPSNELFWSGVASVGGVAYFPWIEIPYGYELWRSDGTTEGTRLLKDITPATLSSGPMGLTRLGSRALFTADDGATGMEPWITDGSPEGTQLLADLIPGLDGSNARYLARLKGVMLFSISAGQARELWTTDGTRQGTRRLLDGLSLYPFPFATALSGDRLFFSGSRQSDDYELWATDGTAAGTARVRDIVPGPTGSRPNDLIDAGGTLFFLVGERLWKSDGTAAGTVQVSDQRVFPGTFSDPKVSIGRTLFFVNFDQTHGKEIWVSDGTAAGTRLVRDVLFDLMSSPVIKGVFAGKVFFADTATCDLWVSDGTAAGSELFREFALQPPGPYSEFGSCALDLKPAGGRLFISAGDQGTDVELWASDGTPAGTHRVRDIRPGEQGSFPSQLTDIYGMLVFSADDGVNGHALWRSDGTAAGTVLIAHVDPGWQYFAAQIIAVGDHLLFVGTDPRYDTELWSMPLADVGLDSGRIYLPLVAR